jgi:uncharacterized membrane protein YkoI
MGRLILAALCLYLLSMGVHADELDRVRSLRASGDILSLDVILRGMPHIAGSRILEVELEEKGALLIYEIERLETGGRVREYQFNARSGELVGIEDD